MSPSRDERLDAALAAKREGLRDEFEHWHRTTAPDGPLPELHSAVGAVTRPLGAALARLEAEGGGPGVDRGAAESRIVGLHQLWGHFRDRLAPRLLPFTRDFLGFADDVAWACYEPALRAVTAACAGEVLPVEPPLIHLAPSAVPFAQVRGAAFAGVDGGRPHAPSAEHLAQALRVLPVPLIGLPWFQLGHLPEVGFVAHEVGHVVLADLGLHGPVGALVDDAFGAHTPGARYWRSVLHEAFADVYGVLALGPAYAAALVDLVTVGPDLPAPAGYPRSEARVALAVDALETLDLTAEAETVRDRWHSGSAAHPALPSTGRFTGAVLGEPLARLGGQPLRALFRTGDTAVAGRRVAGALLAGDALPQQQPVILAAACALAFADDFARYRERQRPTVTRRVLDQHAAHRQRGPRPLEPDSDALDAQRDELLWQQLGGAAAAG
ncbi:hypothetical protein [Kitasatospora sp. NPDC094015]|uniref:hypothetical protein n=1 Tax=Kitasatospora sp. NPDC094015 TaxID=3155205 RepID=UPI00332CF65B